MSFKHPFAKADWIWQSSAADSVNYYVDFADKLYYQSGIVNFHIAVDTLYALYINRKLISCLPVCGYEDMIFYDSINVTEYLHEGENEVLITAYTQGVDNSVARANTPGLIYAAFCGDSLLCASSASVLSRQNSGYTAGSIECVSGQLGFSFRYDATAEDISFAPSVTVEKCEPQPRPIERLHLNETAPSTLLTWGSFTEKGDFIDTGRRMQYAGLYGGEERRRDRFPNAAGSRFNRADQSDGIWLVFDLGREECGLLELDLELTKECEILIGWGQHMEDLRARTALGGRNFAASYHAPVGRSSFIQPFKRLGARYLQLHIYAEEAVIYKASLIPTNYPLSKENFFSCSDHLHNKIYEVSCRTLELCMHEHYEDCEWREQALYTMDSRNQMLCGYYCFGETRFPAASLKLIAHSLREDGMLELCSPARVGITIPSFTAIFLRQLYEFYLYSGDTETVNELLPTAMACADAFIDRMDETHLIPVPSERKYWNFYEWQSGLDGYPIVDIAEDKRTYDAPLNAFVVLGLRSLAKLLEKLDQAENAKFYITKADLIAAAAEHAFFDEADGIYYSFMRCTDGVRYHKCELTQSLFVYADMVPIEKQASVLASLASGKLTEITLSYSIFKYEALLRDCAKYGRSVFNDIAKIWGGMLYAGATSFWETADGADAFGFAGSLCHGWSAVPAYLYYRYALGIHMENGSISPIDCGLYECRGRVQCGGYEVEV